MKSTNKLSFFDLFLPNSKEIVLLKLWPKKYETQKVPK